MAHRQRAVELAETFGEADRIADSLASLAQLQRKRGHLSDALAACDQAGKVKSTRQVEVVRYETLRSLGCFEEAITALERARQLDRIPTPSAERLSQSVLSYGRAAIRMEQGVLDEVPSLLSAAREGLRGKANTMLGCESAEVRLCALQLQRDDVLCAMGRIEHKLTEFAQDRSTRLAVLGNLGCAAIAIGDYDRALTYWEEHLAVPALPVDVPTAYFHLGEAHRGRGDELSARDAYRRATDTGLDTWFTRLARTRMEAMAT
jgi:tetratricopeptide (TPR) repeat protein